MTSPFARNYVKKKLDREYYLQTTKEGLPLQGQVPQTYQRYSGVGSESLEFDGSARVVLESDLASGPLTVNILEGYNLHGRVINLILTRTLQNDLIINYPDGQIHVPGTDTTSTSVTIPTGQTPSTYEFDFWSITDMTMTQKAGTPGPADPGPRIAQFDLLDDNSNVLDNQIFTKVKWDPNATVNTTTVTYDATNDWFDVNEDGYYVVSYPHCYVGNLNRAVQTRLLAVRSGVIQLALSMGCTSGGLVTQNGHVEFAAELQEGDRFRVESRFSPVVVLGSGDSYGEMNGENVTTYLGDVVTTNFITIVQL